MGATTRFPCSLAISVVAYLAAASLLVASAGPVPAMYVLGDSIVDVGNNDYLKTTLRADFPHNGIDYPGRKATGRFSNGYNIADFIADKVGLVKSPPPYLSLSSSNASYVNGVNFASGGGGILNATNEGKCLSLDTQIGYLSSVYASLVNSLGQQQAATHLAESLFVTNIGNNEFINYGLASNDTRPPQEVVDALIPVLTGQLQQIYDLGMRRLLFLGSGPVGCTPVVRLQSAARDCSAKANNASALYNAAVASLLEDMAARLPDLRYALFNSSAALLPFINEPAAYGFNVSKVACCGLGDLNAQFPCTPVSVYCRNRTSYVYWDLFHPSEAAAGMLANTAFDGSAPLIFPVNLRQLSAA